MYDLAIFAVSHPGVTTVFTATLFALGYITAQHRHT